VFHAVVLELVPFLTAVYVALRSGAAMVTQIAMMQASGELEELRAADIDPFEREFVPRIAAAAISVFALTIVSSSVVMVIAYLVAYGNSPWAFAEYTRTVALVFGPLALAGFLFKCLVFGAAVAVIPIAAGLDATRDAQSVPLAVMGGMVRLFVALALIELAALAVKYV
jgi:phospholipid/cholesterol/gamma-HCH transport system permease protein